MKTDILYVLGRIAFRISARVWKQFLLQGHPKAPIPKQYFIPTSAKKCPSAAGFSLPDPPQAPSQKKMLFANHPHAPCIVLSDQFQHLLKAMLLKTTRNCGDLLLQLLHKGGSTPPWSQSELLLLGGVDPPRLVTCCCWGGSTPPRLVGACCGSVLRGDPYEEVL